MNLEAKGITSWLADDGVAGANPFLGVAAGGIKLYVAEADQQRARVLLDEVAQAANDAPLLGDVCLSCGATMSEADEKCADCGWSF